MKHMKLFRALGEIDPKYVDEATRHSVSKRVWMPVAAAAACVALAVGLWQGGVFAPAQLPVEPPTEGSTTEVNEPTDTDVVTDPTDTTTKEPDADTTTDGTADTTTDTKQPDQTETKNPTATDKADPTKTEKPAPSVTDGTDKTEPTKNTTTGKDKPTTKPTTGKTKPTTKTEPTKTTATTEKKWPVIVADKPSIPVDEYPDSVCPLLKIKMEQYKGVDVKYSVIVEIYYPNKERDYEVFLQNHENLAQVHKEYYDLNDALEAEAKRISPNYPADRIWNDKMREINARMDEILDEMNALEDEYFGTFATNLWNQRRDTLSKIAGAKLVPISTDSKYVTHVARNTNEAFFVELTAEEITALEKDGGFLLRLKYPGGDWGAIDE